MKYNFGTQYYDDFMMKPFGKNMLYDLANGGDKSVLMLLLLQNVIPNCVLDEKQPIEKLFRTNHGSTTIHSLIEWQLNDNHINNGFQYMTTGFCARKAVSQEKEEENVESSTEIKDTVAIEYFNYCIFYQNYNENDIKNLPLVNGKERITYLGLKKYLKELEKDHNLIVKVFERKGEYQRFIQEYGIYESEWEIIRGINKTEGHVRTYFESNYKTTRKVVEDLLIEEIIQKSFLTRTNQKQEDDNMADTLISIKDKLLELSKRKNEIRNYNRQVEILETFIKQIDTISQYYQEKEQLEEMLVKSYNTGIFLGERKRAEYEKLTKEMEKLERNLRDLGQCIEIVKLRKEQYTKRELKRQLEKQESILLDMEIKLRETKEILARKESINAYIEFLQEKKNRDEVVEAVYNMKNKNEDLLTELHILAYNRKLRDERRLVSLERIREDNKRQYALEKEKADDILWNQREIEKQIAIEENNVLRAEAQIDKLSGKAESIRKRVNLLFLDNIENAILESERLAESGEHYIEKMEEMYYQYKEEQGKIRIENASRKHSIELVEKKIEEIKAFIQSYQEQKKKAHEIKEVYSSSNLKELKEKIDAAESRMIAEIAKKQEKVEELQGIQQQLEQGIPLKISKEAKKVKAYLDAVFEGSAIYGMHYLEEVEEEEKSTLIQKIPLLPYAIIMRDDYDYLLEDKRFWKKDFGSNPVPIISMEALKKENTILSKNHMIFTTIEEELFLSPQKINEKREEITLQIASGKNEIEKLKEQQQVAHTHNVFLVEFVERYDLVYKEKMKIYENLKKEREQLEESIRTNHERLQKIAQKAEEDKRKIKKAKERKKEVQQEIFDLTEIKRFVEEKREIEQEKEAANEQIKRLQDKRKETQILYHETQSEVEMLHEKWNAIAHKINQIEKEWEERFASYYLEQAFYELDLTDEEIASAFGGKKLAFESENTDLEDKERLIKSYENAMKKSLRSIEEKDIELEQLEQLRQENLLVPVGEEELRQLKYKIKEQEQKIKVDRLEHDNSKEDNYQLSGKIQEKENSLLEKYGKLITLHVKESECDTFITEHTKAYKLLEKGYIQKQKKAKNYQEDMKFYEDMEKDIDRILRTMEIPKNRTKEQLESGVDIRTFFSKMLETYEKLRKDVRKRKEEFNKKKMKTVETLRLLEAYDLADELAENIQVPKTYEDAMQMIQNLYETNQCILLEKERLKQGTEDLRRIKDNFENQCLQRCSNIKTELERLSKLSKINLDGEKISIIQLNIPYMKEELEKQQMSMYIDDVVKGVDQFTGNAEKMKFIRNALSWKKLFSVIVTDMNKIKLSLYKRERMKEQSRHLRYEEAVGSTGQSQGIYIQFLIAIINYITNLNSVGGEKEGLRKVIFIDNPFGAAKDVYIWEPIFEMLKKNQVQLIVPARGTTPAITGRFDVNYVLGQKLVDNKQQTVVVDYQSNVNSNQMEYTPLNFEQTSMF